MVEKCNFCGKELVLNKDYDGSEVWFVGMKKFVKCWDCVKNKKYDEVV